MKEQSDEAWEKPPDKGYTDDETTIVELLFRPVLSLAKFYLRAKGSLPEPENEQAEERIY